MDRFTPPMTSTPLPILQPSPLNPSASVSKGLARSRPSIHPLSPPLGSRIYGQSENVNMDYGTPMSLGGGSSYMGAAFGGVYGENGDVLRSWKNSVMGGGNAFGKYAGSLSGMSFTMQSPTEAIESDLFLGSYNPNSYSFTGRTGSYRSPAGLSIHSPLPGSSASASRKLEALAGSGSRGGPAKREADYCKNYVCCGTDLHNMHDLLEHYEESHVVVISSPRDSGLELSIELDRTDPFQGLDHDVDMSTFDDDEDRSTSTGTAPSSTNTSPVPEHAVPGLIRDRHSGTFTIGAAIKHLVLDDLLNQTEGTPATENDNASAFDKFVVESGPSTSAATPLYRNPSSSSSSTKSGLSLSRKAFNGGLSEKSRMQSASAINSAFGHAARRQTSSEAAESSAINFAVAPTVLFDSGVAQPSSPQLIQAVATSTTLPISDPISAKVGNEEAPSNGEPAPSLFATYRPYRCPQPGCQKSYKQANGLKYHMSKGQCNFEVRDSMEFGGLSQMEAEEKARPFLCAAGDGCQKRYRQMNGLKYHYLNSGTHGEAGLTLLAQNQHPQPPNVPLISKPRPSSNTIVGSRKMDRPFRPSGWVQDAVRASGKELGLPVGQERRGEDAVLFVADGCLSY